MTEQYLSEIEERAEKASPGPWYSGPACVIYSRKTQKPIPICNAVDTVSYSNIILLVRCRTDIPALTAEVRRLRKALEEKNG